MYEGLHASHQSAELKLILYITPGLIHNYSKMFAVFFKLMVRFEQ